MKRNNEKTTKAISYIVTKYKHTYHANDIFLLMYILNNTKRCIQIIAFELNNVGKENYW